METFPQHSAGSEGPGNREIGIIKAVLESGHSVELPATGYSMFPTLRPGDKVIVKPLTKGKLPEKGSVVVFVDYGITAQQLNGAMDQGNNGALVLHRLIGMTSEDHNNPLLITRGDSMAETDKLWPLQNLLGVAESFKRGIREHPVKTFVPGILRYKLNLRLLWLFYKLKRVRLVY